MTQTNIDLLTQEVAHLRAENKRLRIIMNTRRDLDARQIRELEQAVQNLIHVTVPLLPAKPFGSPDLWSGSFVWDTRRQLRGPAWKAAPSAARQAEEETS